MAEALSHQLPRLDMNERTGHAHSGEPLTAVTSGEVSSDRDRYSQATLTEEERALEGDPIRKLRYAPPPRPENTPADHILYFDAGPAQCRMRQNSSGQLSS